GNGSTCAAEIEAAIASTAPRPAARARDMAFPPHSTSAANSAADARQHFGTGDSSAGSSAVGARARLGGVLGPAQPAQQRLQDRPLTLHDLDERLLRREPGGPVGLGELLDAA